MSSVVSHLHLPSGPSGSQGSYTPFPALSVVGLCRAPGEPRRAAPGIACLDGVYPNVTVVYAIDVGPPFFLGTNPTRTLTFSGLPLL